MTKHFNFIAITAVASACVLSLPAHAGLLGGSGGLGGGIGGSFGNGTLGGSLGIDSQAGGRIVRPDTTRATEAVERTQGQAQGVRDGAAQKAAEAKGAAAAKATGTKDKANAAAAESVRMPKADGALSTDTHTSASRHGVSADAGGQANPAVQH